MAARSLTSSGLLGEGHSLRMLTARPLSLASATGSEGPSNPSVALHSALSPRMETHCATASRLNHSSRESS
eukprot:15432305-Alexandrium_andersonii.AAC.1